MVKVEGTSITFMQKNSSFFAATKKYSPKHGEFHEKINLSINQLSVLLMELHTRRKSFCLTAGGS